MLDFFQRFWLNVGPSILVEVKKIFQERKFLEALNHTHITLIPKVQGLESIGNYKPIGLCNTLNKMVTKIIVERIRPLLVNVIHPSKQHLSPGKVSTIQLLCKSLSILLVRKKGKVRYMAIKIDLEKAYDRLEWSFITEVLFSANFPMELIKLILSCVSSTSTQSCLMVVLSSLSSPPMASAKEIPYLLTYSSYAWKCLASLLIQNVKRDFGT